MTGQSLSSLETALRRSVIAVAASLTIVITYGMMDAAGAQQAAVSSAERRAQINRIVDGLNSADPVTRLVTLEQAISAKDLNLRRIALSTAFSSSDPDLRGAALAAAVSTAATFVVDLVSASTPADVKRGTGGSIEIRIHHFDRAAGTFETSSRFAGDQAPAKAASAGAVSGDRISFSVDLRQLECQCTGVARLQGGTSTLKGTMGCTFTGYGFGTKTESYDIKIDIPR